MSRAFTLLELLVAIAILAILVAISVPGALAVFKRVHSAGCLDNLRSIGVGLNLYLADHDQRMPDLHGSRSSIHDDVPVIDDILTPYLQKSSVFRCPFDSEVASLTGTSYSWNTFLNKQTVASLKFVLGSWVFDRPSDIPILNDKKDWHAGRKNFLYADGSAGNHPLTPR